MKRTKRRGLLRNVAIALGNSANPVAVPVLAEALANDAEPLVRMHAAWALGKIGGSEAQRALAWRRGRDPDDTVAGEIELALAGAF